MCPSDPVAALVTLDFSKYPKLFSIVAGEGLTNDSIAIILFEAVYDIAYREDP